MFTGHKVSCWWSSMDSKKWGKLGVLHNFLHNVKANMFWQCYNGPLSQKTRYVCETRQGRWQVLESMLRLTAGLSSGSMPWWAYSGHLTPRPKCVPPACVMTPCLHEPAGQDGGWDLGTYYSGRLCCQLPVVPVFTSSTHTIIFPTFMSKNIFPPSTLVTFPKISITMSDKSSKQMPQAQWHVHSVYTTVSFLGPCWHAAHCLYKTICMSKHW